MKNSLLGLLLVLPLNLIAFSLQGDVSAFRPTSSRLREIYGPSWIDYKVEMEQPLFSTQSFWKRLSIFADVSYTYKGGHSEGIHYKTDIQIVPLSLGLKWVEPIFDGCNLYLGLAPRYYFLTIHDYLQGVKQKTQKNGLGGVAIFGFTFDLSKSLYFDIFASYSFKSFNKPSTPHNVTGHSLQVGGLDIGGGLGWRF